MFTNVLAAIDRVSVLDATVLTAARIAEKNNGKLHIIHVLESASTQNRRLIKHFKTGEEIVTGAEYDEKAVTEEIKKVYDDVLKSCENYEIRVIPGFPWEEILRWARQMGTDLIVLGPHSTRAEEKGVVRVVGKIGSTRRRYHA